MGIEFREGSLLIGPKSVIPAKKGYKIIENHVSFKILGYDTDVHYPFKNKLFTYKFLSVDSGFKKLSIYKAVCDVK